MKIQKLALGALLMGTTMGVAQAQTEAGKLLLNGRISYFNTKSESSSIGSIDYPLSTQENNRSVGFTFSPQISFFVANNLALGIATEISTGRNIASYTQFNSTDNTYLYGNSKSTSRGINIGPFVRYYKMIGEKTGFYGQLDGRYQYQSQKTNSNYLGSLNRNDYYETKTTGGAVNLTPGFVYFPSPKVGLELTMGGLSYYKGKTKTRNSSSTQTRLDSDNSGFNANLGIQYLAVGASLHL
ncbi:hypothetical protein [Hymenobacter volaticus]|uniref:Outer membrane protein beta-barrel domain-containing protein n=1 Tax=Hymenobacter volaticus TaxID=2932254 RepID=A0ABY4G5P9_9BACT|nr:hypothetical protein [Hymenobacter volaticus]UOQ66101.1 hypothetical protein MUN86_21795 [Hymenobacter volaticus]